MSNTSSNKKLKDAEVMQDLIEKVNPIIEKANGFPSMSEILDKVTEKISEMKETILTKVTEKNQELLENVSEYIEAFQDYASGIEKRFKTAKIIIYTTLSLSIVSLILSIIALFV